jgi:CheY-like chemotaxis protein
MNKILIVDDEPNNRILLEEILEDFEEVGTQLLYAANGTEALDLIKSEKPNMVFLDVMLPEVDGFYICDKVKSEPGFENIFIAVLTAKSQDADKKRAVDAKADMYITKPFKAKVIIDAVNKVLGNIGSV